MAEPGIQNWKEKYLTALEDFEASHKKDQQRLDILRRGLVRVSLAADGLDGPLDEQLAELRVCLRGNKDTLSLEPLIAQLERTVVALDDRRKQEQDALLSLLEKDLDLYLEMDLPRQDKSTIRKLRKDLPDLIASHGSHLTMWQDMQQVQERIHTSLQTRITELSQNRGSFLSRLFSSNDTSRNDTPKSVAAPVAVTAIDAFPADNNAPESEPAPPPEPAPMADASDTSDAALANLDKVEGSDISLDVALNQRLIHALSALLGHLDVPADYLTRKENLLQRVLGAFSLDLLPDLLDEAAQLVASTRMLAQKEFESFLLTLHQRLADIQQFLETARAGEEQSQRNQEKLDADVRKELMDIRGTMQGSEGINRLRDEIDGMVNRIVAAVDSFHSEEKKRRDDVFGRIELLGQRMESMEAEATQLKSSLEAQRLEALRDALTEMPNRAAYDEHIEREFSRWRRHGRPLSICVVDIDHFKQINDTLGHLRGDKVLKLVAREVSRRMRHEDFVARYGGEEFVIIMPETDQQAAILAAEKVRQAIAECPFNFNNEPFPVTASFGVAAFEEGDDIETCFERADKALYRAKAQGRNRVERG